jgi:hypothetical protein
MSLCMRLFVSPHQLPPWQVDQLILLTAVQQGFAFLVFRQPGLAPWQMDATTGFYISAHTALCALMSCDRWCIPMLCSDFDADGTRVFQPAVLQHALHLPLTCSCMGSPLAHRRTLHSKHTTSKRSATAGISLLSRMRQHRRVWGCGRGCCHAY